MFGFIKMIQQFISKLRSNKRLWFTTIVFSSAIGIILATYMLISTTNRVSNKVYIQQTKDYELRLKSIETMIQKNLHQVAIAFKQNNDLITALQTTNQEAMQQIANQFNSQFTQDDKNAIYIKFYSVQNKSEILRNSIIASIQSKNNIFGVEVIQDGIFYIYLNPIVKDDQVIGLIEVRKNIYSLSSTFNMTNQEHVFLLDSKMLPLLSLEFKEGTYIPVGKNYLINNKTYTSETMGYIDNLDNGALAEIAHESFTVTKDYYLNGVIVRDTNGVDIGLVVMGEKINNDGGFISIAKDMTNQVVMIALGLIVSLLLFLF
jgi:hypothetical protein